MYYFHLFLKNWAINKKKDGTYGENRIRRISNAAVNLIALSTVFLTLTSGCLLVRGAGFRSGLGRKHDEGKIVKTASVNFVRLIANSV